MSRRPIPQQELTTLVMPSMSDDDRVFDPRQTSCVGMGVVAETDS